MKRKVPAEAQLLAAVLAAFWIGASGQVSRADEVSDQTEIGFPQLDEEADDSEVTSDPLETVNRGIFWFNERVDRFFLEPVATAWDFVLPDPVQTSIRRVFDNARFPVVFVNDLLQLRFKDAAETTGCFLLNTTVGWGGLFDAGKAAGWERHESDFGQTLGHWGVPPGPYLVIPLLGPSNPRDAVGLAADSAARVYPYFLVWWVSSAASGTNLLNRRSLLIEEIRENRESAFDYYAFVRNAYVQYRENRVKGRGEEALPEPSDDLYYFEDDVEN